MGSGSMGLKGWLLVSGAMVLAAGACLGFLAGTYLGADARPEDIDDEPRSQPPESMHLITNSQVYDRLSLGAPQRAQADRILSAHFQKLKVLRSEWEALGVKVEKDLEGILDEAQRESMRKIVRQIKIGDVASKVSEKLSWYRRELALSTAQEDTIYPLFVSDQFAKDELFRDLMDKRRQGVKTDREEAGKAFAKLSEDLLEKVRPLLSPEQLSKFKELEKRRQGWWGGPPPGGAQRPPGGPPHGDGRQFGEKPQGPESKEAPPQHPDPH